MTSEFTVGEKVAFKFEIVKEHSDGPFETLDYIKYGLDNNGKAPKIDKFLKKNNQSLVSSGNRILLLNG